MKRSHALALSGAALLLAVGSPASAQILGSGPQCIPAVANPSMYHNCRLHIVQGQEVCRCAIRPQALRRMDDRTSERSQTDAVTGSISRNPTVVPGAGNPVVGSPGGVNDGRGPSRGGAVADRGNSGTGGTGGIGGTGSNGGTGSTGDDGGTGGTGGNGGTGGVGGSGGNDGTGGTGGKGGNGGSNNSDGTDADGPAGGGKGNGNGNGGGKGNGNGNNGHGNDPDGNDSSNPGGSNNGDGTDADGPAGGGNGNGRGGKD